MIVRSCDRTRPCRAGQPVGVNWITPGPRPGAAPAGTAVLCAGRPYGHTSRISAGIAPAKTPISRISRETHELVPYQADRRQRRYGPEARPERLRPDHAG